MRDVVDGTTEKLRTGTDINCKVNALTIKKERRRDFIGFIVVGVDFSIPALVPAKGERGKGSTRINNECCAGCPFERSFVM